MTRVPRLRVPRPGTPLPRLPLLGASAGMAGGLLLVGAAGYTFLAVTGHASTPTDAAALSSLYFLIGLVTLGVFVGLEQETSRATSRAIAAHRSLDAVARTARRHTLWLLGASGVVLTIASPLIVDGPLRGHWSLFAALLVATGSAASAYLVRGRLGGRQQFAGYAATLATEGLARLVPSVLIFLTLGSAAWAYGLVFAAAPMFAALVGMRSLRMRIPEHVVAPGKAVAPGDDLAPGEFRTAAFGHH